MQWLRDRGFGLVLLALGGAMIALGVARGEHWAVLEKAIRVCLECIGIG